MIGSLVSPSQSAFIRGRSILDNVVSAQEAILSISKAGSDSFLLKLDFEKAFDNVKWSFLFKLLRARGFPETWIGWMEECLSSSKLSCLINGSPGDAFKMRKGLKQGCPLSPLFFIQVVDSLDAIFKTAMEEGYLDGISDERRHWSLAAFCGRYSFVLLCE